MKVKTMQVKAKYAIGETVYFLLKATFEPVRQFSAGIDRSYLVPAEVTEIAMTEYPDKPVKFDYSLSFMNSHNSTILNIPAIGEEMLFSGIPDAKQSLTKMSDSSIDEMIRTLKEDYSGEIPDSILEIGNDAWVLYSNEFDCIIGRKGNLDNVSLITSKIIGKRKTLSADGIRNFYSFRDGSAVWIPSEFTFFNLDDAGVRLKKMMHDEIQRIIEGEYRPKEMWGDNHG